MVRVNTAATEAKFLASTIAPVILVELELDDGTVRFWNGQDDIPALGFTWLGMGDLLDVSQITETTTLSAEGITVSLSGIPAILLATALVEDYQGRRASVFVGAFDTELHAVIVDPTQVFAGYMDIMNIREDADSLSISLAIEGRIVSLERPNKQLLTAERQKVDFPNDVGFDFVVSLQDKEVIWK